MKMGGVFGAHLKSDMANIEMTDWNQADWLEGFEHHAKQFGLEPTGNRGLQSYSICVPITTGALHHPQTVGRA